MHEHIDSVKTYVLVFIGLIFLTVATTAVAFVRPAVARHFVGADDDRLRHARQYGRTGQVATLAVQPLRRLRRRAPNEEGKSRRIVIHPLVRAARRVFRCSFSGSDQAALPYF
jgi:hypothetical protein